MCIFYCWEVYYLFQSGIMFYLVYCKCIICYVYYFFIMTPFLEPESPAKPPANDLLIVYSQVTSKSFKNLTHSTSMTRALVLVANGTEELEAVACIDILRRAGVILRNEGASSRLTQTTSFLLEHPFVILARRLKLTGP